MNKADLVNLVAARTELTKTDVSLVVDAAIETIVDSVVEGKKVSLLGFGSFEPRDRSARQRLNLELSSSYGANTNTATEMPAAQSFIQILRTFLATLFIFYSRAFSFIKNNLFI